MNRSRLLLGALVFAGSCTENVTAPGQYPECCPGGQITVIDTVLQTVIGRDSAYRGFVLPREAAAMLAADLPGIVDSRPIFRTVALPTRVRVGGGADTTTGAILSHDSAQLRILITRRDTAAHNLTLRLYRLPLAIDSSTTFAALATPFTDSLLRTVNIDSLIAKKQDPVTGDSARVDSAAGRLEVVIRLDTAQARFVTADSGKVAYGLRVSADSLASIAIGANEGGGDPLLTWFVTVDSAGVKSTPDTIVRGVTFDSFVFDPPPAALDSTLAVGGVPSARSLLRMTIPDGIRDSTQIVRATLVLVPASPAQGVPADSFFVVAHGVDADFGGKSPLAADSTRRGSVQVKIGQTDTVRIDLTRLLRVWSVDTTAITAVMLRMVPEGSTLAEIRFQPSDNAAYRPALHLTYVPRFPFGIP
ncbi:MAG: hypothetical protein HYS40_04005 [Gemmatimonadetes bacterium]|nr:hypothetical protein [Gemmatimonadota bacterium]